MSFSLSEISTVAASFADDLAAYRAAGFDGIGIWESKLGDDDADLAAFRASGLRATNCVCWRQPAREVRWRVFGTAVNVAIKAHGSRFTPSPSQSEL